MKSHGHKRYDMITCKYGCCATKYSKQRNSSDITDRARRKTARQHDRKTIFTELIESDQ